MDRERLDNWCEKGILGLVLTILVFGPLATGAVRALEFLIVQGLTLGVLFLWAARFWLNRSHRLLWPPICWALLAFVIYAVVRYLQADIEYVARLELIKILVYAVLFLAVLNNLHRQETAQLVVYTLVFLAMVVSVYALYQFITSSEHIWNSPQPLHFAKRASGTFIVPNHFAGFAEMILPLGVAFTLSGRLNTLMRVFLGYASLVIMAGIGTTISRAGWACAAFALILTLFLLVKRHHHYRIPALVALLLTLSGGILFYVNSTVAQERLTKLAKSQDNVQSEYGIRTLMWKSAYQMWKDNPWAGVGPGHFGQRFPAYRDWRAQVGPTRAHNDYLNTLADWGLIGLAGVLVIIGLFYLGVFRCWKFVQHSSNDLSSKPSNRSALVLGATVGITAIVLHSFVDFNLHIPANAILFVTLMALATSNLRFASERYWITVRSHLRLVITALAMIAFWFLGTHEVRRIRENLHLRQAQKGSVDLDRVASLERAHAIEPGNFDTSYRAGEILRLRSRRVMQGFEKLAADAAQWYRKALAANPHDFKSAIRLGMCLHWRNRHEEAAPWFDRALKLDPNGYYTLAHLGWHFVQIGDWTKARVAFERSIYVKPTDNKIAATYLRIIAEREAAEKAGP